MLVEFGRLPYIGTWDQNFPGIVYYHGAIISVFGPSGIAFRAVDLVVHLAGAYFVARLMLRRVPGTWSYIAGWLYAIVYMFAGYWMTSQRDGIATIAILGAACLYFAIADGRLKHRTLGFLSLGFILGVAFSFRPTLILIVGVFGLVVLLKERAPIKSAGLLLLGFLGCWLLILVPYFRIDGGLQEFYTAVVQFNVEVYGAAKFRKSMFRPQELGVDAILLIWLAVKLKSGSFRLWPVRNVSAETLLFVGCYLSARVGIIAMGKFYIQHYDLLLVLSLMLLISTIWSVWGHMSQVTVARRALGLALVSTVLLFAQSYFPPFAANVVSGRGTSALSLHEAKPLWDDYDPIIAEEYLSRYLESRGATGKVIECCGVSPGVYWRSRTSSASRFTTITPLVTKGPKGGYTDLQRRFQKEYIDSLRTVRPSYIVLGLQPKGLQDYFYGTPAEMHDSIAGFNSFLSEFYNHDTTMNWWSIYRVKLLL